MNTSAWLFPICRSSCASPLRLFCFPYAGAGAQMYYPWARVLPPIIDGWALQPPGRGPRLRETPLRDIHGIAFDALTAIQPLLDVPVVFFGHSMGALVAFEVSRLLRKHGRPTPVHLLLSGTGAPDLPALSRPMHQLPDDTFVEKLREYNGTPRDVLENRELMALLLPILRADFEACETYRCDEQSPLDMPLTLFGGEDDVDTPPHYFDAWRRHTKGPLTMFWFRGDHFFLHTASDRFLSTVVQVLNSIASSTSHERHW